MSRLSQIVAIAVAVVVVVGAIFIVLGEASGQYMVLDEQTNSMAPLITSGAAVVMVKEPVSSVRKGQVVATIPPRPYPQEIVIHEIASIERKDGSVIVRTRGVANPADDPWATSLTGGTVWKEALVVPDGGLAAKTLHSPLLIAVSMAMIVISGGVFYIWREIRYTVNPEPEENIGQSIYMPRRLETKNGYTPCRLA